MGHYLVARRSGVEASFPYFVPQLGIVGTSGAFVKLSWPIADRQTLMRIFVAGPAAGFVVSTVMLTCGFLLSESIPQPSGDFLILGDSLLTLAVQTIVFPGMAENEQVLLHPVGLAGYFGLSFNLWHVFPAGRLDGGRAVYALLGYRRGLFASWATIALLMVLGILSPAWPALGIFAALTLIRLKRQHPVEQNAQPIDRRTIALALAMLAILVLSFVPVPVRPAP
jgi:membrane-associated protease RseP (regulator of RpoE activity)